MKTRTAPTAPERATDTRADKTVPNDIESPGMRWTAEPIENSTAAAVYCPVVDAGRWNGVMHNLHQRDPGLAKRWGESKRQPKGADGQSGWRTTVLALARSGARNQLVLYCYEGDKPGSGIRDAACYAEQSGLQELAIDGRGDHGLASEEGRAAIAAAAAEHETELVVHLSAGPRQRTDVRRPD